MRGGLFGTGGFFKTFEVFFLERLRWSFGTFGFFETFEMVFWNIWFSWNIQGVFLEHLVFWNI